MGPDASPEGQNKIEIQWVVPRWPGAVRRRTGVRVALSVVRDPSGRTNGLAIFRDLGRACDDRTFSGESLRFREKAGPIPRSLNHFVPVGT